MKKHIVIYSAATEYFDDLESARTYIATCTFGAKNGQPKWDVANIKLYTLMSETGQYALTP